MKTNSPLNAQANPKALEVNAAVRAARSGWRFTGSERPEIAESPKSGQRSVWDFPRPPVVGAVTDTIEVRCGDQTIAVSTRAREVLETSHAPTIYIPPGDFDAESVRPADGAGSHCEWKGISVSLTVLDVADAGWMIARAYPEFEPLVGWAAFYPNRLTCLRAGQFVGAQGGGYYGGWVTPDLAGPIKGGPHTAGW